MAASRIATPECVPGTVCHVKDYPNEKAEIVATGMGTYSYTLITINMYAHSELPLALTMPD